MLARWNTVPTLDRVLDDVMRATLGYATTAAPFAPAVDVRESDQAFTLAIDVPGVKMDDLEVTLEGTLLTIKGARRTEAYEGERVVLGRAHGEFALSYTLPDTADGEQLAAELEDGVLNVRVPKRASAQPRRIAIGGPRPEQGDANDAAKQLKP